ncbi:MAG: lipoyl(octanoyl) transferase LipB [Nitrospirales bacterium]|nr:lipoyl(octanoyl) transferase LipB [Nitrospirales bacterium]
MSNTTKAPESGQIAVQSFMPFAEAWDLQKTLVQERLQDRIPDTLILTQHEPILTFGRTTKPEHWETSRSLLQAKGITLFHIERGGSVTYHGPGQLVGYPILRLRNFCPGPKVYVHQLEEVLIRTLAAWDIYACRHDTHRGVWVEGSGNSLEKIASIGVRIDRGITMHGFALNVNGDLWPFSLITPCGIEGVQVTSMAKVLDRSLDMKEVQERIIQEFSTVFGLPLLPN